MTPEGQMKAIKEAAGGKWEVKEWISTDVQGGSGDGYYDDRTYLNPSPTDLNELFGLADKLDVTGIDFYTQRVCNIYLHNSFPSIRGKGDTPADALREALYQSLKGEG